jgi:hypothetical protein
MNISRFSPTASMTRQPVHFGADAPGPIGQGQTLPPTPITLEQGIISVIRKENSTANLKRDVWMVQDPQTQQKYSLFTTEGETALEAMYDQVASWGEGARVRVTGIASKPVPMQRFPFLIVESIERVS